ncbi:MAG TPA: leucyl/phenylalanyl-tRNA--protein transferase [Lutibacter sp.]|nr:leucyl/phenylalanyl-tRNA--protein transferase [Lutibacter sp.]
MFLLGTEYKFPPTELASDEGILAIGGDLHPNRLLEAYNHGIFPWYNEGEPIVWYSPDPRMVLFPDKVRISKSMRKIIRDKYFKVTFNQYFKEVIRYCKSTQRAGQQGTWITDDLETSMIYLHEQGIAKSVEVWQNNKLVGGLYGLDLGSLFCGESMFSIESNASKFAFISLAQKLEKDKYPIIDCQVYNDHLASLGAVEISRSDFKKYLP